MDERYTCLCGSQRFSIYKDSIRCENCQREYRLLILDEEMRPKLEGPVGFNRRIRRGK